jgi:hypothetical protein
MTQDREFIRRMFVLMSSKELELIQEVANAILDDRGIAIVPPQILDEPPIRWMGE